MEHTVPGSSKNKALEMALQFHKLGLLVVDVLILKALLLGVHIRAPDFWKLPNRLCTFPLQKTAWDRWQVT